MLFCWYNVLIVLFLYFPAIDANNSGEEEEVVRMRILFILLEFLFDGVEEVQGQISQGKPSFDLLLFILLVVLIAPLYTWFLVSCVIFGPLLYAYLFPKYVEPLVDALHTCSQVCEPPC
jgi:hypothetical protein